MAAKIFEVNDVLPATTQLRITGLVASDFTTRIVFSTTSNGIVCTCESPDESWFYIRIKVNDIEVYYQYFSDEEPNFATTIDISSLNVSQRTVNAMGPSYCRLSWEDLNAPLGYTITFNSNGGTTISDIEEATELPTPLPTPTKSGYKFVAWYYESNFQTRANAGDTIEANTTLYAKWHNLGTLFTGIANAIRSKDGTSGNIRDLDFDDRIMGLDTCIYLTQEEYDLLDPPNENITYIIVEVE